MSEQQVTLQRVESNRGYYTRSEICEICDREVERDRDTGKWFMDDREVVPTWVGKYFLCSEACQSQHMYNIGTDKDRELLSTLARFCNTWLESGIRPENHEWCVQHLHSGMVVDLGLLIDIGHEVERMVQSFAGDSEFPKWYLAAIGEVVPGVPAQKGLELVDGESFGPAPLVLFGGGK